MCGGSWSADGARPRAAALHLLFARRRDGRVPAVPVWPDAGDLRAVLPRAERRRDLPNGRRLDQVVRRHSQARADGEHSGVVRTFRRAGRRGLRSDGGDLGGRRAGLPPPLPRRRPAVLRRGREPRDAEPPGRLRLRHRPRLPVARRAAGPVHLGARRAAHLDAAVRPARHVRRRRPVQPLLRGGGDRPRRVALAAVALRDAADPAARHRRRGGGRVHPVV